MTAQPAPRKPRHFLWPLIVVGLLLGHLTIMMTAVVLASRDKSFTVLPDYYQQAVNWDKNRAELRASERLGWQATIVPAPDVDAIGRRAVALTLTDAAGKPIPNAAVELTGYHHARPADLLKATFRTDASGRASQTLAMPREGFYQLNLSATAGRDHFVNTQTQFVSTAKRGPS